MSEEDEASDGLLEEDEVFLADDGARYSNFSAIKRINDSDSLKSKQFSCKLQFNFFNLYFLLKQVKHNQPVFICFL